MGHEDIGLSVRQLLIELKDSVTIEAVGDDTPLIQESVLDSFDMISLIALIEEKFGIAFDPNDVQPENFQSIQTITTFLAPKLSDASGR